MEIKVLNDEIKKQKSDILVLGMIEGTTSLDGVLSNVDKALGGLISEYVLSQDKFEGKFKDTYLLQTYGKIPANKVLIVGLGKKEDLTIARIRELSIKVAKKIKCIKGKTVTIDLGELDFCQTESGQAVTEGFIIGDYAFDKYKSEKDEKIEKLILVEDNEEKFKKLEKGARKGEQIGLAMNATRDLVNEPPQYATPTKLAELAKDIDGIKTKIYDKKDCEKMGMGAFLGVARGSVQEPKFIHMQYTCPNPKKRIAIIGKGLCFDSGGMDLKPASSMLTMKDDMSGAGAVINIMKVLAKIKPEIEVHGIIAACENMPGQNAYKPGDILTAMNKKTIEIDNTDAEGRVTMADALCYACKLNVEEVIDIATLTGACMVALGYQAGGILGNNQKLIENLIGAGEKGGEKFWQLPMFEEYFDSLKSKIADMKNSGTRGGGASAAALFLQNFVSDNVAWAHLDVAGTAWFDKPHKEIQAGPTAPGIRTVLNYLLD